MDRTRRSPYLVLGIDYGATAAAARRAFAQKSKLVKQMQAAPYDVPDLTWALQEVEQAEEGHGGSVEYFRVPARRAEAHQVPVGGLFTPAPTPTERQTVFDDHVRREFEQMWIKDVLRLVAGSITTWERWPPDYEGEDER